MNVKEQAVFYKHNGHNCCQAVVRALMEHYGKDHEELLKASAGFAVGMGTMEATCGSLIGANMVLGIMSDGNGTLPKSKELLKRFEQLSGATICKKLKGVETGEVLCPCDDCIMHAVAAALEQLGEN